MMLSDTQKTLALELIIKKILKILIASSTTGYLVSSTLKPSIENYYKYKPVLQQTETMEIPFSIIVPRSKYLTVNIQSFLKGKYLYNSYALIRMCIHNSYFFLSLISVYYLLYYLGLISLYLLRKLLRGLLAFFRNGFRFYLRTKNFSIEQWKYEFYTSKILLDNYKIFIMKNFIASVKRLKENIEELKRTKQRLILSISIFLLILTGSILLYSKCPNFYLVHILRKSFKRLARNIRKFDRRCVETLSTFNPECRVS